MEIRWLGRSREDSKAPRMSTKASFRCSARIRDGIPLGRRGGAGAVAGVVVPLGLEKAALLYWASLLRPRSVPRTRRRSWGFIYAYCTVFNFIFKVKNWLGRSVSRVRVVKTPSRPYCIYKSFEKNKSSVLPGYDLPGNPDPARPSPSDLGND